MVRIGIWVNIVNEFFFFLVVHLSVDFHINLNELNDTKGTENTQ